MPATVGHGDPINDASFSAEITATLARGAEGFVGGGTWRYTLEYSEGGKLCTNAWGFRVVPGKAATGPRWPPGRHHHGIPLHAAPRQVPIIGNMAVTRTIQGEGRAKGLRRNYLDDLRNVWVRLIASEHRH